MQTFSHQPLWFSDDIASYSGGTAKSTFAVNNISIDSRTVAEGDLFIALKGEHIDGHNYVASALEKGAGGALVSYIPEGIAKNAPLVVVKDTMTALYDLAKGARWRAANCETIGVTGSVGKTGTKEMLFHVLGHQVKAHATQGNLNNHLGLPLSLIRMPQDTRFGIFEMGMNHAGEITPLSHLTNPKLSIITWVAPAHIEFFNGIEDIARAKAEIFEGMNSEGIVVLPHDNPQFPVLVGEARTKGIGTILSFGSHEQANGRILSVTSKGEGSHVNSILLNEPIEFFLPIPGFHHAQNAMAVLLATKALGMDVSKAIQSLSSFKAVQGRGNMIDIHIQENKLPIKIIDETYNASPESMKAALNVLSGLKPQANGRRIAVIGDMLELGNNTISLHKELAETINNQPIDVIHCCGAAMKHLADILDKSKVIYFENSKVLSGEIRNLVLPGDILMIKGSHGSHMEYVVAALKELEKE